LFYGFELAALSHLDLSGNELEVVPESVLQLTFLQSLNLADNRIFKLPPGSAFNSLNALTYLDLGGNR
jgi:Leucine-rich repeat (LRR) protein